MRRLRCPIAASLTLLLAATAMADDVVLVPGSNIPATGGRIRGKIERETPTAIRIGARDVPLDQVAEVIYDAPGISYSQARIQASNGNLPQAAELYQKAVGETNNSLVAQDARFRRAAVLAQHARVDPSTRDAAIQALESVTTELANSRHLGPALELLAALRLEAREFDAADQALRELATLSWAADRAAVLRAQVMVKRGQSEQALRELETLIGRLREGTPARRQAELARAEALVGLSRFDEAEQAARAVIDAADPEDAATLAPSYNTLGDCLRAAGRTRDALFAYLHTDILYPSQAEEHARALAAIAELWRVLDENSRAAQVVERLEREYPNSPYLPAARGVMSNRPDR
ncbi:tetratricopeptide repeat protein [Tautonia sociabilis]|uniref:Tetratricopeptide repeat protein n=1 Tax=Tautonia sociabilis TaxID=2080755 RepID=A0A432MN90_9BACT|nr:tetratricopeptide repeat protein [Tautonia sociabilis]RUL88882.1 tetratricopeptide repeat protein [Tautonia sociabilis]